MLDIRRIRQEPEIVMELLRKKHVEIPVDEILGIDRDRRALMVEIDQLKAQRNQVSEEVARMKKRKEDASQAILAMRDVGSQIKNLEEQLGPLDQRLRELLMTIPNPPLSDVPEGDSADDNREVYKFGTPFPFIEPKPHWEIGEALDIIDFERARKISGSRFSALKGLGSQLSRALINFMLDHARHRGYLEITPPYLVNAESMVGTGQFPKFREDAFGVDSQDLYLIPTAEVPVTNLHRGEILSFKDLPLKYTAYTESFRSEAGAAGRDTRGLIRQHQFSKVELVQLVEPSQSDAALESMRQDAQSILEELNIPFRTVLLCGGDMGFGQAKTYDIEVWMPSYNRYVEISSCSNMTDFQARRAEIRYRPEASKKTEWPHTLNGSALAVGRTMAAILENYQDAGGHVMVPEVLKPYLGGIDRI